MISHDLTWSYMISHDIAWLLISPVPELPISEGRYHIGLLSPEPSEPSAGGGTVSSGTSVEDTATGGCFLPGQLNWCYSFSTHCTHMCMECYHTLVIAYVHVLTAQDLTTHDYIVSLPLSPYCKALDCWVGLDNTTELSLNCRLLGQLSQMRSSLIGHFFISILSQWSHTYIQHCSCVTV